MQTELFEVRTIADALRAAAPEAGEYEVELLVLLDELEEHARRESEELWPAATALIDGWREPLPLPTRGPPRPAAPRRSLLRRAAHRIRGLLR
ncbi:MAG: hypothetical protein ACI8S6_003444 [Myxococcota bacterium]|jgi:hypothetical protein